MSYIYIHTYIEMQVVKNGSMPFNKVKTINKEIEKMLVLIMNEVETNRLSVHLAMWTLNHL